MPSAPQTRDHLCPEPDRTESPASILPHRFSGRTRRPNCVINSSPNSPALLPLKIWLHGRTARFPSRTHLVPTTLAQSRGDSQIACRCSKAGWGRCSLEKRRTARPRIPILGAVRFRRGKSGAAQPASYRGGERKTLEIAEHWPGRRCRQGCPFHRRAASLSQQGAPTFRRATAVSRLRANAIGSPQPPLHATACAWSEGERRIRCSVVPDTSPRGSPDGCSTSSSGWPKSPRALPAACVASRLRFGRSASKSPSAARGEGGRGSSG